MRVRQMLAGLAALVLALTGALAAAAPAAAGGWALTVLDPLPDRLDVQRAYTVGFWVLQHGTHPFYGERDQLGEVGIKLVGERGQSELFRGVVLPDPAHYAATMVIPEPGRWRVVGVQGIFAEYEIGTITAPGALTVLPVPVAVPPDSTDWTGPIRPPQVPVDSDRDLSAGPVDAGAPPPSVPAQAVPDTPAPRRTAGLALGAGALLVVGTLATAYLRRRARR